MVKTQELLATALCLLLVKTYAIFDLRCWLFEYSRCRTYRLRW